MLTIWSKILLHSCDEGRELIVDDLGGLPQVHYFSWGMQLGVEQQKVLELVVEDILVPEEDMPRLAVEGLKWVVMVVEDPRLKFYYHTNVKVEQIN